MKITRTADPDLWQELATTAPGILRTVDSLVRTSDMLVTELANAGLDDVLRHRLRAELCNITDALTERAARVLIDAEHEGCRQAGA